MGEAAEEVACAFVAHGDGARHTCASGIAAARRAPAAGDRALRGAPPRRQSARRACVRRELRQETPHWTVPCRCRKRKAECCVVRGFCEPLLRKRVAGRSFTQVPSPHRREGGGQLRSSGGAACFRLASARSVSSSAHWKTHGPGRAVSPVAALRASVRSREWHLRRLLGVWRLGGRRRGLCPSCQRIGDHAV